MNLSLKLLLTSSYRLFFYVFIFLWSLVLTSEILIPTKDHLLKLNSQVCPKTPKFVMQILKRVHFQLLFKQTYLEFCFFMMSISRWLIRGMTFGSSKTLQAFCLNVSLQTPLRVELIRKAQVQTCHAETNKQIFTTGTSTHQQMPDLQGSLQKVKLSSCFWSFIRIVPLFLDSLTDPKPKLHF